MDNKITIDLDKRQEFMNWLLTNDPFFMWRYKQYLKGNRNIIEVKCTFGSSSAIRAFENFVKRNNIDVFIKPYSIKDLNYLECPNCSKKFNDLTPAKQLKIGVDSIFGTEINIENAFKNFRMEVIREHGIYPYHIKIISPQVKWLSTWSDES